MNKVPNESHKQFQEFLSSDEMTVSNSLTEKILNRVHIDLNPSGMTVFSKFAFIHATSGAATLLVCPQFNVNSFFNTGIEHAFMRLGEVGCMLSCGGLFLGFSALFASLFLRIEEVKVIRKNKYLQVTALGLLSMGGFLFLGAELFSSLTLAWLAGTFLAGVSFLELGWMIRSFFKRNLVFVTKG